MKHYFVFCLGLIISGGLCAQAQQTQNLADAYQSLKAAGPRTDLTVTPEQDYKLGPGDVISVSVNGLEDEFKEKIFRVDGAGSVTLPLVGRIHATGETVSQLESSLVSHLEPFLKNPQAVVTIQAFGSEPVSVLGAVRSPGIVQLQGYKTLFDTLSLAGGLQPDAGYSAEITRPLRNGAIPLPGAQEDKAAGVSVATVRLKDIINKPSATQNIQIMPGDTVSVPKTGIVYAVGSVMKPGGFPLNDSETLSAMQVLALAEGLAPSSAATKARVLRVVPGSPQRQEIPVDLKRLSAGKSPDIQLQPDDILFVPNSAAKAAGKRTIDAIVNAATYASVYAR